VTEADDTAVELRDEDRVEHVAVVGRPVAQAAFPSVVTRLRELVGVEIRVGEHTPVAGPPGGDVRGRDRHGIVGRRLADRDHGAGAYGLV
jgi:hypothetical protein